MKMGRKKNISEGSEAVRRIKVVQRKLTQTQLAKQLGVVPSLISGIESGRIKKISKDMLLRLARFAALHKFTSDAQWFLSEAGFDRTALDAVTARKDVPDFITVLPRDGSSGDPLLFPRKLATKRAKLEYLTVTEESTKSLGGAPGDRIVLDTSITNHTELWEQVVVIESPGKVRITRTGPQAKPEQTTLRPIELLIGRLRLTPTTHDGLQYKAELTAAFGRHPTWKDEPEKWLGWYPEPMRSAERNVQKIGDAESKARQHMALGFGYHVVGRFVAWIGSPQWEAPSK